MVVMVRFKLYSIDFFLFVPILKMTWTWQVTEGYDTNIKDVEQVSSLQFAVQWSDNLDIVKWF